MGDAEREMDVIETEEPSASEEIDETGSGEVEEEEVSPEEGEERENLTEALRQEREANSRLKNQVDFLTGIAMRQQQSQPERREAPIELDPDEPVTGRMIQEILSRRDRSMNDSARNDRIRILEAVARTKYPDYDEAIDMFHQITATRPDLKNAILNGESPAEDAYLLGKSHPSFIAKLQKKAAVSTVKKVVSNSKKVSTLAEGSVSKSSKTKGSPDFENMSSEEFQKYVASIKERQYK